MRAVVQPELRGFALPGGTRSRLRAAGIDCDRATGEEESAYRSRLCTSLMDTFRCAGRREDFETLYALSVPWVRKVSTQLIQRRGLGIDPDELVQDTFVNVYRYARSFRVQGQDTFRAWTRTIASNLLTRRMRRRKTFSLEAMPEGLSEPVDLRPGPPLDLVRGEEGRAVAAAWLLLLRHYMVAFRGLSERDRRALGLIEIEGLSYVEAAERLDVRLSNMKMIMFRARKRLRARLRESLGLPDRESVEPLSAAG